jgi:hypothetical protein
MKSALSMLVTREPDRTSNIGISYVPAGYLFDRPHVFLTH